MLRCGAAYYILKQYYDIRISPPQAVMKGRLKTFAKMTAARETQAKITVNGKSEQV